jgi:holo-[acyl-carrier protein] synthase
MILGIGTDVVDVARIEQKVREREAFCRAVFSEDEQAYCDRTRNRFESYSARFAAKEAFLKALGTGLLINHDLHEVEVRNEPSGRPVLCLSPLLRERVQAVFGVLDFRLHVSLSHTAQVAVAYVMIESVRMGE